MRVCLLILLSIVVSACSSSEAQQVSSRKTPLEQCVDLAVDLVHEEHATGIYEQLLENKMKIKLAVVNVGGELLEQYPHVYINDCMAGAITSLEVEAASETDDTEQATS